MMPQGPFTAGVVLFLGLLFAASAPAQLPFRWFGPKSGDKNPPSKSPLPDARRVIEINVEVAWLADPVTFPYYLEAHVNNVQQLEVRGYVPNRMVREHALRTAQVYSSLTVMDSMKEHPSLLVRPSQMSPLQLQSSVLSSLKAALPKQASQLKINCGNDGKVYVFGPVNTLEEKVAVSHSLRRLHGCTSVQNMTSVTSDLVRNAPQPDFEPKMVGPVDNRVKPWLPWNLVKGYTNQEPPLAEPQKKNSPESRGPLLVDVSNKPNPPDGPILIPPVPLVKDKGPDLGTKENGVIKVELPTPAVKTGMAPTELQKRILLACPKASNVQVTFIAATELRIVIDTRSSGDISPIAERIFAMPELQNYRADLQFRIGAP